MLYYHEDMRAGINLHLHPAATPLLLLLARIPCNAMERAIITDDTACMVKEKSRARTSLWIFLFSLDGALMW